MDELDIPDFLRRAPPVKKPSAPGEHTPGTPKPGEPEPELHTLADDGCPHTGDL